MAVSLRKIRMYGLVILSLIVSCNLFADPQEIEVTLFSELAFYPERSAPARVISLNEPVISTQISAQVLAIPVRVGDRVKKGEVLAQLDCRDFLLNKQRAEAALSALNARRVLANQRVKRALELESRGLVSTDLLEERQADLQALAADFNGAKATLEQAQLDASRCQLISPFNGVVTERISAEGQYANLGSPLLELVDLEQLEVSAQVFSEDAARLTNEVSFSLEHDGRRFPLKLRQLLPVIHEETRQRELRLEFTGAASLPGASGKLTWQDPRPHLPADVWLKRDQQMGLFIEQQGKAHFVPVPAAKMGRANPLDLPADTRIVTRGHVALQHGQTLSAGR